MAAIYGTVEWKNTTIEDVVLTLHQLLPQDFYRFSTATGIVVAILSPVTALLNSIVIAAIWKDPFKQLRSTPSNIIIGSMAACDFLGGTASGVMVSLFCFYFSSNVQLSSELAPISFAVLGFFVSLSVFHDLALMVDRLIAVINPLLYKLRVRRKRVLISMIFIWLLHLVITIPQVRLLIERYYVHGAVFYVLVFLAIGTASFLSLFIIYTVRKQTKEMKNTAVDNNYKIIVARQRKLTKSFLIIFLVLRVCFSPCLIVSFIILTCSSCHSSLTTVIASFFLSVIMMYLNFFINPCLYAFRLPKFKRPVTQLLKRAFCCCPSNDTGELQNTPRLSSNNKSNNLDPKRDKYTSTKL